MMTVFLATSADFAAILALQELNHLHFLPEEARSNGFLTTYLETPKLEFLCQRRGLFVAKNGEELAGFVCAEAWDLSGARPFHTRVATLFPLFVASQAIHSANSLLYGPVCVAAPFRGQNVLAALIGGVQTEFKARFSFGITFIDHRNGRSLAAHERKLGFSIVGELPSDDTTYHVLAFPL